MPKSVWIPFETYHYKVRLDNNQENTKYAYNQQN